MNAPALKLVERPALTEVQARMLSALQHATRDGWPATVREVMRLTGHHSTSTVHGHLLRLERLGLAGRHPRSPKGGWLPTI